METIKYINRKTGDIIIERPPGEGYLKFLYHNPFGALALNVLVKRKLLSAIYGKMMDSPNSVKRIPKFVSDLEINMNEAIKPLEEFSSFNDFFYRKLHAHTRPIGEGIVSPADAKLIAFEHIEDLHDFYVKGQKFTLSQYLKDDTLAKRFENSSLFIFRLAPNDYHRYHFPCSGDVSETTKINGSYFSVSPYALEPNITKVFCENKREFLTLATEDKGEILISPVGATMVGTIITTHTPNSYVHKGDEMGYFAFGGSTIVMLVDKELVTIAPDILENTKNKIETAVQMGEQIGT